MLKLKLYPMYHGETIAVVVNVLVVDVLVVGVLVVDVVVVDVVVVDWRGGDGTLC